MAENSLLRFGRYTFDRANEQLQLDNHPVRLTNKACAVLCYLVEHAGHLVTKDALFAAVWCDSVVSETALTNCIGEVRRALGDDPKAPRFIETVQRRGYRFLEQVVSSQQSSVVSREGEQQGAKSEEYGASRRIFTPAPSPQHLAPVLVGREAELTRLHNLFAKARNGERQIVFVTGEAGIGKTSLIDAFRQRLEAGDWRLALSSQASSLTSLASAVSFAHGQCIEQYGASEAYLPVLEALGRLGRGPQKKQVLAVLQHYAPTWMVHLPALLSPKKLQAVQRRAQSATRERMLREIVEALDVLSAEYPLVLVLEDLHWSDPSTVELLATLARRREVARLLVVGTYRAAELAVANHPLKTVKQELVARRQAAEIALSFLSPAAVREYMGQHVVVAASIDSLADVVYRRTDGQPLFMVQVTDYLLHQFGPAELAAVDSRALHIPQELRELIEAQLGRLTEEEQQVLALGSVVGTEFTSASIAAGMAMAEAKIEEMCTRLVRRGQFIEERGVKTWPDGSVSERYGFRHALYFEVLYAHIPEARRGRWHKSIGEWEERAWGERTQEIAAELAMHFEHGRDFQRAIQYRYGAAQRALGQHASREALDHLTHGLKLLTQMPAGPIRTQYELMLQTTYGVTLATTLGYADPAVAQAHLRAYELSQEITDPALLFPILCGLWGFFIVRSDLSRAMVLADHLLALEDQSPNTTAPALAYGIHGQTSLLSGKLLAARISFAQSLTHYTADQHGRLLAQYNEDPGVISHTLHAQALWLLGYADQAPRQLAAGEALAHELAHPYSFAQHLCNAMTVWQWRGEVSRVIACYEELQAICQAEAFPVWLAGGMIVQGWALVQQGQNEAGVTLMQQGIRAWQTIGICLVLPYYQTLLAEAYGAIGQADKGVQVLDEVLAHINATQERFYEAELWRIKGMLLIQSQTSPGQVKTSQDNSEETGPRSLTPDPQDQAEACFLKAIEVARQQQAKSLELRAVMSLVRLCQQHGTAHPSHTTPAEAHRMLVEIYNWFTEGFETKDLQEAKALLENLGETAKRDNGEKENQEIS